jgi:hypothetical protein
MLVMETRYRLQHETIYDRAHGGQIAVISRSRTHWCYNVDDTGSAATPSTRAAAAVVVAHRSDDASALQGSE